MELTVQEVLKLEGMRECRVLAGAGGLERVVKHVSWIEVPDVIHWLRGNELLFTHLYAFQSDSTSVLKLIQDLNYLGSAALAVKTGCFIRGLPSEVLVYADTINFPIIEVPSHLKYLDLTNTIVMEMFERESHDLRLSEQLHKRFITEVLKQGGGFKRIALLLSQLIHNPVSIADLEGKIMITVGSRELEGLHSLAFSITDGEKKGWSYHYQQVGSTEVRNTLIPVLVGGDCYGYLLVWEMYRRLKDSDGKVIESVLPILALEFAKHKEMEILRQQYRQDFIDNLILGQITDEETARWSMQRSGWHLAGEYNSVMVVSLTGFTGQAKEPQTSQRTLADLKQRICGNIRELALRYCDTVLVGNRGNRLILITNFKELTEQSYRNRLRRLGEAIIALVKRMSPDLVIGIGVGRYCLGLCGCKESYQGARRAAAYARVISRKGQIAFYDDLQMYEVILNSNAPDKLLQSVEQVLHPLLDYDEDKGTHLLRTLEIYFNKNCQLKETAAEMFVHQNTVKYRLKRIEQLTGRSLASEEDKFHLHLAIKIRALCTSREAL